MFKTLGSKEEKQEDTPKIVEGIIGEALKRTGINARFLRKKTELDFFADGTGIEVKWQENVSAGDFPAFSAKNKLLLSKKQLEISKEIKIIPVPVFLLLI